MPAGIPVYWTQGPMIRKRSAARDLIRGSVPRRFSLRFRLRTLTAVTAVVATLLGLFVYCDRAFEAYRAAISHAESAEGYRWVQGLESDFGSWPFSRFLEPEIWSPRELDYLRGMEYYHRSMSQKCLATTYRPWVASPPEPPKPQLPGDEHSNALAALSSLFSERPSAFAALSSILFSKRPHAPHVEVRAIIIMVLDEAERIKKMLVEIPRRYGQRVELRSSIRALDRAVDAARLQIKDH